MVARMGLGLAAANLIFTAGTAAFIHYWAARDVYGPRGRALLNYVLVQFHLATENVVAAWYSSMLLLTVAIAAVIAFACDRRQSHRGLERAIDAGWLVIAGCFALLSLDEIGSLHERIGMVTRGDSAPNGWVYALAVPIGLIALFMAAFAWLRLRRARVRMYAPSIQAYHIMGQAAGRSRSRRNPPRGSGRQGRRTWRRKFAA